MSSPSEISSKPRLRDAASWFGQLAVRGGRASTSACSTHRRICLPASTRRHITSEGVAYAPPGLAMSNGARPVLRVGNAAVPSEAGSAVLFHARASIARKSHVQKTRAIASIRTNVVLATVRGAPQIGGMTDTGFDDIPYTALGWHRAGKGAVLATVIETWGSAPRPVGSQLAISGDGEIAGSVSGGCVEGAVVMEALEAAETGGARILEFGVSDDEAFAVGLACGGRIRVLVEPVREGDLPPGMLADLVADRAARRQVAYAVDTQTWARWLMHPPEQPDRFRLDRSGFEEDGQTFVAIHNPPLRMVVVGGVHIAQPLMRMARLSGFDAVLVDPRESFASEGRFPGETLIHDWPDEALARHGIDARTAVVTLTHDPKLDDPAIEHTLGTKAFYLGCLGSSRTHAKRVARLEEKGLSPERIHAPVGLDIGARSPAEIAVAIMAEIVQSLRRG